MRRLSPDEIDTLKEAYLQVRHILTIPISKRTVIQDAQFAKQSALIQERLQDFFLDLNEDEFTHLRTADFQEVSSMGVALSDIEGKFPKLRINLDVETIQKAIVVLYEIHSTAQGVLEQAEPMLAKWDDIVTRARSIAKGLSFAGNEWEAEALFNMVMPSDILAMRRNLRQHADTAKIRCTTYKDAYDKLSRFITTMQTEPESMNRPVSGDTAHTEIVGPKQNKPLWSKPSAD
jgi:hypothetical protein